MRKVRAFAARAGAAVILLSGLIAPLVTAVSVASASTTMGFKPVADTYASSAYPGTNYGTLVAVRTNSAPIVNGYLRFVVSGLNGATITSAKLRVHARASSSRGVTAKPVSDDSWGEK